jgi:hypothetical protein
VKDCLTRNWLAVLLVLFGALTVAAPVYALGIDSAVSGVVHDAHGTPQMGVLIQLLTPDATAVATAFTDNHGRFLIPAVLPGQYSLRATAAFFLPASRERFRLRAGAQSVVNLTMSTLFETESWLPTQSRRADEPSDDWKWTLRAAANRPLLRLVDTEDGLTVSSSAEHGHKAESQTRVSVLSGDGDFGHGGVHQQLLVSRMMEDEDGAVLLADIGTPQTPYNGAPSAEVTTGYERRTPLGGSTRMVVSYQSHPELSTGSANGVQTMRLASAQRLAFGDLVQVDAGTLLLAERLAATQIYSAPFVHVSVRAPGMVIEYGYATSRDLQTSDDLDRLQPQVVALANAQGRPLNPDGAHHQLSLSRKLGKRVLEVSAYTGRQHTGSLSGSGILATADVETQPVVVDPTTATFRLATAGYAEHGVSAELTQPVTQALSVWAAYDLGTALTLPFAAPVSLAAAQTNLQASVNSSASLGIRGTVGRTGTALRAQYRWQPRHTLTQVNSYGTAEQDAYLSFYLRQKVLSCRWLPDGMDAVIQATNLLEQGYLPVLAADGHTLYLADVPRSVQGGLAFNF